MRRGGGGSGGDCGFKSAPGARSRPGVPRCCAPRRAEPGAGRTAQPAAGNKQVQPEENCADFPLTLSLVPSSMIRMSAAENQP